jgi:hypothetical protein
MMRIRLRLPFEGLSSYWPSRAQAFHMINLSAPQHSAGEMCRGSVHCSTDFCWPGKLRGWCGRGSTIGPAGMDPRRAQEFCSLHTASSCILARPRRGASISSHDRSYMDRGYESVIVERHMVGTRYWCLLPLDGYTAIMP